MSVLVVGFSHKSAPVVTLERAAVSTDTLAKLLVDLVRAEPVADLPGVAVIGLDTLVEHGTAAWDDDIAAVRAILDSELAAHQSAVDAARVAPTVVALRARAAEVVDAELARPAGRLTAGGVSAHALDELAQTVRRVVSKLLHAPTVRVKELAGSPGARSTPRRSASCSISTHAQSRRSPAPPRSRTGPSPRAGQGRDLLVLG